MKSLLQPLKAINVDKSKKPKETRLNPGHLPYFSSILGISALLCYRVYFLSEDSLSILSDKYRIEYDSYRIGLGEVV